MGRYNWIGIDMDHYKRMAVVRFLPGTIVLVLSFHCLSAFGEEIPTGQPPVPEDVKPAKGVISANEGYIDSSHAYVDRKINEDH